MAPVLGYWKIRGYVQRIRLLLAYTGEKYEEKIYTHGPAPEFVYPEWARDKVTLGLDFPNLPYYIDGDVKISQSAAIIRYLARKHNLDGKTEEEQTRVDMFEHHLYDLHTNWAQLCYLADFNKCKDEYISKMPDVMKQISEFLAKRKYFAGDTITFVDFIAYEYMSQQQVLNPDCLKTFKNLLDFNARMESLPRLGEYIKSSETYKWPINAPMANYSNK